MNLTIADRLLAQIISQAYPPGSKEDLPPLPAVIDWEPVIQQAQQHELAPLLFDAAKKIGRFQEIPPALLFELRRSYLRTANQNEQIYRELDALLAALDAAQIPVILLKGSALAVTLYDSPAQRPMCDLDLLTPEAAIPGFVQILTERGYVPHRILGEGFEQEFGAELCYVRPDASHLTVEPHWHLFNTPYFAQQIPIEWFWQRTSPVDIRGRRAQMLSPTAALLHLAAHFYVHHKGVGLRQMYDIARLLTRWGDQIDWDDLNIASRSFGLLPVVQAALKETVETWHVLLPAGFSLVSDPSGELSLAVASAPNRYSRHLLDFAGLTSVKARLVYLRKLVFPSREYLRQRYGMRDARLSAFYYAYRLFKCVIGIPSMLLALRRRQREMRHKNPAF